MWRNRVDEFAQVSRKGTGEEEDRWKGKEIEKFPHFSSEGRASGCEREMEVRVWRVRRRRRSRNRAEEEEEEGRNRGCIFQRIIDE